MIVGPGGALVNIVNVYGSTFPGFYHIHVRPITSHTWKAGVYVFAIVVQKGINHGQTLAAVMMD